MAKKYQYCQVFYTPWGYIVMAERKYGVIDHFPANKYYHSKSSAKKLLKKLRAEGVCP
mgnify:CR=1 FL=1